MEQEMGGRSCLNKSGAFGHGLLPGRPKAGHRLAEGGDRARPGRLLVFFVHFSPAHITYRVRKIKRH